MTKYSLFKFRWKTLTFMVLIIYAIAYMVLNFGSDNLEIDTYQCPACYGDSICSKLDSSSSQLLFPSNLKLFNMLFNVKNVFYFKRYNIEYVGKKLAHDHELIQFDETLCKAAGFNLSCNASEAVIKLSSMHHNNITDIVKDVPQLFDKIDLIKCKQPSILQHLYSQYEKLDSSSYAIHHFLTLLAINPEPLIIQSKFKGLPLPTTFGMCGRLFVESYEGRRLTQFYSADWKDRVYLSLQLLQMAVRLSKNSWKLFLLDVSPNNFAVDASFKVKLIDAENILILDSTVDGLSNTPHQNDGNGCLDCLSFDFEDLCSHKISDHNYFAICKGLLAPVSFSNDMPNGLLHSIPEDVIQRYPNFQDALQECSFPNKITREKAAVLLLEMLKKMHH